MTDDNISGIIEILLRITGWSSEPEPPEFTVPVTAGKDDPDGARAWLDAQAEQAGQAWDGHRK